MAQYKTGTVTVTNASIEVTGLGTLWVTAGLSAGDYFKIDDRSPVYQIAAIISETHLHLTAVYSEASGAGLSYCIVTDFTAIVNYPLIFQGDIDWPDVFNKFLSVLSGHMLQTILTAQDDIVYASAANTPARLNIVEQRLVGRITGGHVAGLTASQIRTLLALATTDDPTFDHLHLTSGQIGFPAAQVASADPNTQDDYEEGNCTFDLQFGGAKVGITYNAQKGFYTKIGNEVFVTGYIALSNKGSSVGNAIIEGLPFTVVNDDGGYSAVSLRMCVVTFANQYAVHIAKNTTSIYLEEITEAGVESYLTNADFANNSYFVIGLHYRAA